MRFSFIILNLIAFSLTGCEKIAVMTTPQKRAISSHSELAKKAELYFWSTLHQGHYEDLAKVDYLLMAAYLQNPNDPKLAAYIGFTHIWKITERQRLPQESPQITNEIVLAKNIFLMPLLLILIMRSSKVSWEIPN
ncbi:hypothetical protein [Legionella tunisiensis]|uniref:hypothetical protein n=1 Tax=Legionella tunisiensis TaxID=1034944 RepID=UPI0002E40E55|nr:hypothetical protein [Legionella tunisiensis]